MQHIFIFDYDSVLKYKYLKIKNNNKILIIIFYNILCNGLDETHGH